jgi:hypothetical protein
MLGILYLVAFIGNIFPLTVFPQGRILLAGIPVLMIVRLYGAGWGAPAAMLTPVFALALGHPVVPELLWVGEAVIIGMFLRSGVNTLPAASLLFWGPLALPVQYLLYGILLHYSNTDLINAIGLTTINGLGNAVLATMLLYGIQHKRLLAHPTVSFLETEINAIAGGFLLPGLFILALNLSGPRDFLRPGIETEPSKMA